MFIASSVTAADSPCADQLQRCGVLVEDFERQLHDLKNLAFRNCFTNTACVHEKIAFDDCYAKSLRAIQTSFGHSALPANSDFLNVAEAFRPRVEQCFTGGATVRDEIMTLMNSGGGGNESMSADGSATDVAHLARVIYGMELADSLWGLPSGSVSKELHRLDPEAVCSTKEPPANGRMFGGGISRIAEPSATQLNNMNTSCTLSASELNCFGQQLDHDPQYRLLMSSRDKAIRSCIQNVRLQPEGACHFLNPSSHRCICEARDELDSRMQTAILNCPSAGSHLSIHPNFTFIHPSIDSQHTKTKCTILSIHLNLLNGKITQGQGVLTPHMVQMQRLMGNRPQRTGSAFFGSGEVEMTNSAMDLNDQYQMGMSQRNFGTFGQQNHMMAGFSNRPTAADMGNFPVMMGQNCSVGQVGIGAGGSATANGGFIGSLGTRMSIFKCPECGIVKNSNEELEIHIKTEHLGWLPFQCPICTALRASDLQMREHIHSHHKKNENKYIYVDNPHAKGLLQEMIDRALFGASQYVQQMARRGGGALGGQFASTQHQMPKRLRLDTQNTGGDRRINSAVKRVVDEVTLSRNQAQKSLAAASKNDVNQQAEDGGGRGSEGSATEQQKQSQSETNTVDEETDAQLSNIFGRKVKSEFDMAAGCSPDTLVVPDEDEDNLPDDNSHQMNALQNVSAMFSASGGGNSHPMGSGGVHNLRNSAIGGQQQLMQHGSLYRRVVRNRPGPMTSKKRVLGLCRDCEKPITAGARQMHMFYHLGKDLNTYRFRCKHTGCKVQHYRKDQMENHQSKAHGKVDTEMMEDRSMELYNMVQKMSQELLGTTGNTPGPSAPEAQVIYEQQMREMEANLGPEYFGNTLPSNNTVSRSSGLPIYDSANRRVEDLECRLCNKFILNRIKGFHILWHLNTDLGIVRYGCKYCNFKHDRPQSVAAHGIREHSDEAACEDLLYNFEDELKSMSKACFGVERLFEKEIRRRNRLERFARCSTANSPGGRVEDDDNSQHGNNDTKQSQQLIRRRSQQHIMNLKVPLKSESAADRDWTPKEPVRKRRSGARRFFGSRGRKPMSRKARDVMVKLREVSMRLGGAQYFKKRSNEAIPCEKCSKLVVNRLSDHAYSHMEHCDLFRCQQCELGHYSRETIVRHLKDFHNSHEAPMDNRLRFAQEIKDSIRECYPRLFIDAPIPTKEDIEKLRESLNLSDQVLVCEKDEDEEGEHVEDEDAELFKDQTNEDGEGDEEKELENEAEQQSAANDEEEGEVICEEEEEEDEDGQLADEDEEEEVVAERGKKEEESGKYEEEEYYEDDDDGGEEEEEEEEEEGEDDVGDDDYEEEYIPPEEQRARSSAKQQRKNDDVNDGEHQRLKRGRGGGTE
uniref:C2H2-type domain-containing protein n=1 Tax=Globodera pallida TaxID=36090 RepID=A0A183BM72_GLOPA